MDISTLSLLSESHIPSSNSVAEDFDEPQLISPPKNHHRKLGTRNLAVAARLFVFTLAIWGFISIIISVSLLIWPVSIPDVYRPSTLEPSRNLCDCGSNIQEALSKKCIYDSLAAAWLPEYCRDDELTREFDHSGPGVDGAWPYYADANGTIPITKSQVAALGDGERTFWSSRDFHVAHCVFYWEKYVRMRDTGVVMERRFDRVFHTKHCRRLVLQRMPNHNLLIKIPVVMNSRIIED